MIRPMHYTSISELVDTIIATNQLKQPSTVMLLRDPDGQDYHFIVEMGPPGAYHNEQPFSPVEGALYEERPVVAWATRLMKLGLDGIITFDGERFRTYIPRVPWYEEDADETEEVEVEETVYELPE